MGNLTKNRTLGDICNREVVGRLAIPERKSSGVFYFKKVTEIRCLNLNTHGIGYRCRKPETLSGCP